PFCFCVPPRAGRSLNLPCEVGELLPCRGLCAHSWHLRCLGLREVPKETHWICPQCRAGQWPTLAPTYSDCEEVDEVEDAVQTGNSRNNAILMAAIEVRATGRGHRKRAGGKQQCIEKRKQRPHALLLSLSVSEPMCAFHPSSDPREERSSQVHPRASPLARGA